MFRDSRRHRDSIRMEGRQLLRNQPTPSPTSPSSTTPAPEVTLCSEVILSAGGVLGVKNPVTLTEDIFYRPACTGSSDVLLTGLGSPTSGTEFRDPFYASTLPECYALAAATVIAYMLVIMLVITPRTFLHDGAVVLGRRGFTNGPSGGNNGIGIGGRPWLQKVAAASVAISLTIATADTFAVAQTQYEGGYMDAAQLQNEVENGIELKVFRVISDTFLWLAQAQTLIRLFPRQREKVIIKWTAFALISLDVLFSILNNFLFKGNSRPRTFVDAIPALSYLFQLALSLLYCAWVMYYSLTKKRFAFYHPQMKNQCIVALLSLISILIPVVFFVLDISKPDVAGWGDYVRWVGAAAASVVVWEWVERIELLERNEKRDGVLGREVFDGDEMLDVTPSSNSYGHWSYGFSRGNDDEKKGGGHGPKDAGTTTGTNRLSWPGVVGITSRYRPRISQDVEVGRSEDALDRRKRKKTAKKKITRPRPPLWPTRPAPAATPISRTDTASAESTVYAVRYHPLSEPTPPAVLSSRSLPPSGTTEGLNARAIPDPQRSTSEGTDKPVIIEQEDDQAPTAHQKKGLGNFNPFRRKCQDPPAEISAYAVNPEQLTGMPSSSSRWDVRAKIEGFAATQADKIRDRTKGNDTAPKLSVTVIPAPSRRRHYDAALEELEEGGERGSFAMNRPFHQQETQIEPEPQITSRTQRNSDPYRPDDFNGHSMHQRGAISFVTASLQDRIPAPELEVAPLSSPQPSTETERLSAVSPVISRHSPAQLRSVSSGLSATSTRRDGLAVMTIPAPPRRPRYDSDSE